MSDVAKSLNDEIEAVVRKFDFDGDLSANCAELLSIISDDLTEISAAYWDYWNSQHKFSELDNPQHKAAMAERTASFIRERLRDATGTGWRNGLQAQVIDACKRGIALSDVLAASSRTNIQYYRALGAKVDRSSPDYLRLSKAIVDFTTTDLAIMTTC